MGPTGKEGAKGETGATGLTGAVGKEGKEGKTGAEGKQGPQGVKGETGPTGNVGPEGKEGKIGPEGKEGKAGFTGGTTNFSGGTSDAVSVGGVGVFEYWSLDAVTTHSTSAGAVSPRTMNVGGTLSSVEVKISTTSGSRTWTFEVIKNESTVVGSCTVATNTSTCTIPVSPNTFVGGDTAVIKADQASGSANGTTATWTSTYTYGNPVMS
jgi:collagen type VII alpha